jgi:hypothetical protein
VPGAALLGLEHLQTRHGGVITVGARQFGPRSVALLVIALARGRPAGLIVQTPQRGGRCQGAAVRPPTCSDLRIRPCRGGRPPAIITCQVPAQPGGCRRAPRWPTQVTIGRGDGADR